jgi:hypothetical protein
MVVKQNFIIKKCRKPCPSLLNFCSNEQKLNPSVFGEKFSKKITNYKGTLYYGNP